MAATPPFPTFLIIGAERCGARWLRCNLDQHPDICAPPQCLRWFEDPDRMARLGTRWYREQFSAWSGESQLGDFAPTSFSVSSRPHELSRHMQRALPDARLVAIIRHPLERLESAANRAVSLGELPPGIDLWSVVRDPAFAPVAHRLMTDGVYSLGLRAFAAEFGDQLLVLVHDEVCRDRAKAYRTVLQHLGVDDGFVPDDLDRPRYATADRTVVPLDAENRGHILAYYMTGIEIAEEILGRSIPAWHQAELSTEAATSIPHTLVGPSPTPDS
jgi:hypothetical protein